MLTERSEARSNSPGTERQSLALIGWRLELSLKDAGDWLFPEAAAPC